MAYDETGNILSNVEIVPNNISATIEFTSYSKEVPVEVLTVGTPVSGKAISAITVNGETDFKVTIYGEQEALDSIDSVPVTIDISDCGANGYKEYHAPLQKPSGVRYMPNTSVDIHVSFGEAKQKTIENVRISVIQPNKEGLVANATSSASVNVQVIGVQSVIDSIDASSIYAYIDLSDYTVGNYSVPVMVSGSNQMATYIVSSTVDISIVSTN